MINMYMHRLVHVIVTSCKTVRQRADGGPASTLTHTCRFGRYTPQKASP